jgi:hypothetical protein
MLVRIVRQQRVHEMERGHVVPLNARHEGSEGSGTPGFGSLVEDDVCPERGPARGRDWQRYRTAKPLP